MKRTNIYLEEVQAEALDALSRVQGVSRAELIRRILDRALADDQPDDLASDLAAIHESFGVLGEEEDLLPRGPDERSRHLDRIARL